MSCYCECADPTCIVCRGRCLDAASVTLVGIRGGMHRVLRSYCVECAWGAIARGSWEYRGKLVRVKRS